MRAWESEAEELKVDGCCVGVLSIEAIILDVSEEAAKDVC